MKKLRFTKKQVESFVQWEKDYYAWSLEFYSKMFATTRPPEKPPYFDLWKQGPDPLQVDELPAIPCKGSDSLTKIYPR